MAALVRVSLRINAVMAMIISCPACGTRYVVPETAIGAEGRTVRCAKCKHSWFQDPKPLDLTEKLQDRAEETPAAPPPPPPPPPAPPPEPEPEPAPEPAAEKPPASEPEDTVPGEAASPSISHWRTDTAPKVSYSEPAAPPPPPEPEPEPEPVAEEPAPEDEEEQYESDTDPLAGDSTEADFPQDEDYSFEEDYDDDEGSRFDYSPPFTRRRNSLKMWTIAASVFALLATGTVVAVNYYGLPDWLPIQRPTFGIGEADLELDFPASEQRKELLNSGEEIFRVRGSISNTGQQTVAVPSLLVVFRDERERNVGNWVVVPSKRELAPGESLNVTEAITDIPPAAKAAYIGWSPN